MSLCEKCGRKEDCLDSDGNYTECAEYIEPEEDEVLACPFCGIELEVIWQESTGYRLVSVGESGHLEGCFLRGCRWATRYESKEELLKAFLSRAKV